MLHQTNREKETTYSFKTEDLASNMRISRNLTVRKVNIRRLDLGKQFILNIERLANRETEQAQWVRAFLILRNLAICKDYVGPTQHGRVVVLKPRTSHQPLACIEVARPASLETLSALAQLAFFLSHPVIRLGGTEPQLQHARRAARKM